MASLRKKQLVILVLVCIVFASGCGHSLLQEDGQDRHAAKVTIGGEKGFLLSLFGGSSNTRAVNPETEEILQGSEYPTVREAEVQKALIRKKGDLGERAAAALRR